MSPKRGAARLPFLSAPPPPQGKGGWGTVYKESLQPWEPRGGTGEGCLSGRDTECGCLKGAPRMGAGAWDGCPQNQKNSILPFLPQLKPNLPDRGSKGLSSPELALRELGGVGRTTGESPDKVSCTGRGGSTTSSPSGGAFWWEGGRWGPLIPVSQRSPQSPPCPPP